jgi:hypothetical protein
MSDGLKATDDRLHLLAQRVEDDPRFVAFHLRAYAESEHLDDAGIAARLACAPGTLTHLKICYIPRAACFNEDVDAITTRFGINRDSFAEMLRRSEVIAAFRQPQDTHTAMLLAARDRDADHVQHHAVEADGKDEGNG